MGFPAETEQQRLGQEAKRRKAQREKSRVGERREERGGAVKRQAFVVNSEMDKVEKKGDRGGGKEKYRCAEGSRNE